MRARKQHDLLLRALIKVWPPRLLQQAVRELEAAGAAAVDGEAAVSDAVKHAVRANSVLKALLADEHGINHESACLLQAHNLWKHMIETTTIPNAMLAKQIKLVARQSGWCFQAVSK